MKNALLRGISDVCAILHNKFGTITIILDRIIFNDAHFQIEGIYCAIQECICKYFEIPPPVFDVTFDKNSNQYIFHDIKL